MIEKIKSNLGEADVNIRAVLYLLFCAFCRLGHSLVCFKDFSMWHEICTGRPVNSCWMQCSMF